MTLQRPQQPLSPDSYLRLYLHDHPDTLGMAQLKLDLHTKTSDSTIALSVPAEANQSKEPFEWVQFYWLCTTVSAYHLLPLYDFYHSQVFIDGSIRMMTPGEKGRHS